MSTNKNHAWMKALPWAAAAILAAALDAPPIVGQVLLPLMAVLSVTGSGSHACFKRREQP